MKSKGMFLLIALTILTFFVTQSRAESSEATTIILVRHAEEDRLLNDKPLTGKGLTRAIELARVLADVKIDAIFSTDTVRTKSTVRPLADAKGLPVNIYDYENYVDLQPLMDSLLNNYRGKTILISGHSDNVPAMISMLRKEFGEGENLRFMPKTVYDDLFIVFVPLNGKASVLELKYGQPTAAK
jgi:2,3-bisphosphoglycerate-dependent phosphoglycerate mutase